MYSAFWGRILVNICGYLTAKVNLYRTLINCHLVVSFFVSSIVLLGSVTVFIIFGLCFGYLRRKPPANNHALGLIFIN